MKVWFIAVLLAVAVATSVAAEVVAKSKTEVEVVTDVPQADDEVKVETVGEGEEEESETEGKEGEKEEGGSNESSSEENNEEENKEEESSTKTAEEVTTVEVLTKAPVVYTTEAYIKPAYVVSTTATYNKANNYIQVPGPVYKPVTTEAPKPLVVVSEVVKISVPSPSAVVEKPKIESKYVKPIIIAAELETTTKYAPIVFVKPSSAPVVTVRKSGWVRAPGYNLGYARSESSDPAIVETPKTSKTSQPAAIAAKKVVARQTYPQWFFQPKSAIPVSN